MEAVDGGIWRLSEREMEAERKRDGGCGWREMEAERKRDGG